MKFYEAIATDEVEQWLDGRRFVAALLFEEWLSFQRATFSFS